MHGHTPIRRVIHTIIAAATAIVSVTGCVLKNAAGDLMLALREGDMGAFLALGETLEPAWATPTGLTSGLRGWSGCIGASLDVRYPSAYRLNSGCSW